MTKQEAIDILYHKGFTFCNFERCVDFYSGLNCEKCEEAISMAIVALQQEPTTGKWVQISPARIYECSHCKMYVMTQDIETYHYCHHCGAKMEVEE